jgi:hypothetical protein
MLTYTFFLYNIIIGNIMNKEIEELANNILNQLSEYYISDSPKDTTNNKIMSDYISNEIKKLIIKRDNRFAILIEDHLKNILDKFWPMGDFESKERKITEIIIDIMVTIKEN